MDKKLNFVLFFFKLDRHTINMNSFIINPKTNIFATPNINKTGVQQTTKKYESYSIDISKKKSYIPPKSAKHFN